MNAGHAVNVVNHTWKKHLYSSGHAFFCLHFYGRVADPPEIRAGLSIIPSGKERRENLGLKLSKAMMSSWLLVVYRDWFQHVVSPSFQTGTAEKDYLHIDKTHEQALKELGRKIFGNIPDWILWIHSHRCVFRIRRGKGSGTMTVLHAPSLRLYRFTSKSIHDPKVSKPEEVVLRLNKLFEIALPSKRKKNISFTRNKYLEDFWS